MYLLKYLRSSIIIFKKHYRIAGIFLRYLNSTISVDIDRFMTIHIFENHSVYHRPKILKI